MGGEQEWRAGEREQEGRRVSQGVLVTLHRTTIARSPYTPLNLGRHNPAVQPSMAYKPRPLFQRPNQHAGHSADPILAAHDWWMIGKATATYNRYNQ